MNYVRIKKGLPHVNGNAGDACTAQQPGNGRHKEHAEATAAADPFSHDRSE